MKCFDFSSRLWIIMPMVVIALGVGVISVSVFITQRTQGHLESDFANIEKMLIEHLQERALYIFQANSSIYKVARIVGSAISTNSSLPSVIETNVAPGLFMALKTIQLASQISFVGANEVIFSYFHERDQTHVLFSNTSSKPFNSSLIQWYAQKVDEHTGQGYGDAVVLPPIKPNHSLWFSDALEGRSRQPSYGYGWANSKDEMFFFTAPVNNYSVVALGIKLKDFINYLLSTNLHDAHAYVFTEDGYILDHNKGTLKAINVSKILPVKNITGDYCHGTIDKHILAHPLSMKHWFTGREKVLLYCAPIHMAEIQLVIVVAFPMNNVVFTLQVMKVTIVLLLSSVIVITIIGSCISSKLFKRLQEQRTYGLANLIKQKEATQQAERKSMNKSLAFASASHDVRASLAGITGLIKLCHDDVPPDSDVARNLIQMDVCALKLLEILNSVLDTSKVEAGKMQLEDVEFNMAQAIEESVDIFHVVALPKGLEVIWDPCDFSVLMSPIVRGDCRRFKQILDNLLSNAVKFTSEGHVIVRAWAKKAGSENTELTSIQLGKFSNIFSFLSRWLCSSGGAYHNKKPLNSIYHGQGDMEFIFEVDDTGTGIPKDKRASIFENYVQVKESNSGYEGTGLGLGIVQSYVRLMGGDIGVREKEPGESGSCFTFNIFLKSNDISSNDAEGEHFDSPKSPILNKLRSFSSKTRFKMQSNIHTLSISQGIVVDGIWCLLLIHGAETRRILQSWMECLGIKVIMAKQPDKIYAALKRTSLNCSASGSSDLILSSSSVENNEFSCPRDENSQALPLSMKDLFRNSSTRGSYKYLLVILDLSFGNFSDIHSYLTGLSKNNHCFHQYKIICLTDSTKSCSLMPCDLKLRKPLHGSRINKILGIIKEFRQKTEELKPEAARESCSTGDLETRTLLNSASSQQNNSAVLHVVNDKKPLSGMHILLVEDTLILRQVALKLLSKHGATVRSADDGLEALNVVKEALKETSHISQGSSKHLPFDCILMDCQMPIMDGYESTKCIRMEEQKYGIHIPIIALTAHATPDEAKNTLLCGMDFHLAKPIDISKLLEVIKLISCNLTGKFIR